MPPAFEWRPDESETLATKARYAIERRIATLLLAPGSVVSERELADTLQFGKAAVREGLQRLSVAGLVSPRTGSGYLVAPITLGSARSLFEVWRVVEPEAITAVLRHAQAAELIAALETVAEGKVPVQTALDPGPEDEVYVFSEAIFHLILVAASDNRWFQQLFMSAMTELERLLRLAHRLGADIAGIANNHAEYLAALRSGDLETAHQTSRDHIDRLESAVFDVLLNSDVTRDVNLVVTVPDGQRGRAPKSAAVPST